MTPLTQYGKSVQSVLSALKSGIRPQITPQDCGPYEDYVAEWLRAFDLGGADATQGGIEFFLRRNPQFKVEEKTETSFIEPEPYVFINDGPKTQAKRDRGQILIDYYSTLKRTERQKKEKALAKKQDRLKADEAIPFLSETDFTPEDVRKARQSFTSAKEWRNHVILFFPDLDPEKQYDLKVEENKEERARSCETYTKSFVPGSGWVTRKMTCGVCEKCMARKVATIRRALNELQNIPTHTESFNLKDFENDNLPEKTGEDAPPLKPVQGELSYFIIEDKAERDRKARYLRDTKVRHTVIPYLKDDKVVYGFLVNNDEGDPVNLMVTDSVIRAWLDRPRGTRVGGSRGEATLLPSIQKLERQYRHADDFEVVMPNKDDEDILALAVPVISTEAELPKIEINFEVTDASSLQAAINQIKEKTIEFLRKRNVEYHVYRDRIFYTRYSTLNNLIPSFMKYITIKQEETTDE